MLIMPGFITDVVGLLLLLPFTRPGVRSVLGWWVSRVVSGHGVPRDPTVIEGEVVEPDRDHTVLPQISPDEDQRTGN